MRLGVSRGDPDHGPAGDSDMNDDEYRFTMMSLRGRSTGLPMNIWIGPGHAGQTAIINVQTDHREKLDFRHCAVVTVETKELVQGDLSAADLERVRSYIARNHEAILDHWNGTTDSMDLARALQRLPEPPVSRFIGEADFDG
jgi:hypothetical protein